MAVRLLHVIASVAWQSHVTPCHSVLRHGIHYNNTFIIVHFTQLKYFIDFVNLRFLYSSNPSTKLRAGINEPKGFFFFPSLKKETNLPAGSHWLIQIALT